MTGLGDRPPETGVGPGGATTVVFLPGSLCDERLFAHQIDALARTLPVAVADFGGLTSIEDMAERVLDTTTGRFVPVGLSMGGIVAAELLDRAPERIPTAVLLDTNLDVPGREQLATRHRWASRTRAGQYPEVVRQMVPTLTADVAAGGAIAADMALAAGPTRFLDENEALINRRRDRRPNVARYRRPVLVIVGEADPLCPPSLHRALVDSAPQGRLVVVPGAGHLSTIDRPESITSAITEWLVEQGVVTTYSEHSSGPFPAPADR